MRARNAIALFFLTTILGGIGGVGGSMLGHAFGQAGLFAGGIIGGLVLAATAAKLAAVFNWIPREAFARTVLGAAIGFIAGAAIAVNTLSSPVGPFLGSLLTGVGAVLGARSHIQGPRSNTRAM
ncbi:MAG TPA: hypothetical protein VIF83_08835 [Gemmatimonadaceae bacterium]|jgi:hypothetical protein